MNDHDFTKIKRKLINKIHQIQNDEVLEEMFRLIINEETDNDYQLSDDQINSV